MEQGNEIARDAYPGWVFDAPYVGAQHPQAEVVLPIEQGANCQRYAYAFLALHGLTVAPHRSSELWEDERYRHPDRAEMQPLDLALFNRTPDAWGAHVAVCVGRGRFLHLSREVGKPVVWQLDDFASRSQYAAMVGLIRVADAAIDDGRIMAPSGVAG